MVSAPAYFLTGAALAADLACVASAMLIEPHEAPPCSALSTNTQIMSDKALLRLIVQDHSDHDTQCVPTTPPIGSRRQTFRSICGSISPMGPV